MGRKNIEFSNSCPVGAKHIFSIKQFPINLYLKQNNNHGKYLHTIHIRSVFAPKFRYALIEPIWKGRLHQYITGIVQNHNHKMLCIDSMPDHLHMFFGMRPDQSLSELMRLVKGESSE
jgi:REP element-mobilizing transposase RayT